MSFDTEKIASIAEDIVQSQHPHQTNDVWMNGLRASLSALRSDYYTSGLVRVDYSNAQTIQAYTLGYAPYHAWQTYNMLENMQPEQYQGLLFKDTISIVCICGGPGFEVLGLIEFLKAHNSLPTVLNVTVVDKHAADWSRFANLESHLEQYGVEIRWTSVNCTLRSPLHQRLRRPSNQDVLQQTLNTIVSQAIVRADIVTAQNCLNEIALGGDQVVDLLAKMKDGAIFSCSDLSGYRPNIRKMIDLKEHLSVHHTVPEILSYVDFSGFSYTRDMEDHFFQNVGGLWARRKLKTVGFVTQKQTVFTPNRRPQFLR